MERPVLTISCQAKVLPHLRRQWQISQQIERESRPPTASTHTRDSGNKKVRRLLDDVGLDVKRLLIFSAGGHLLSVAGDRAAADEAALRADPRLLMRFLLVMLSLQDPEYDAPRPLRTDKSAATFSNVSRVPRSDCAAQTYELKVLALSVGSGGGRRVSLSPSAPCCATRSSTSLCCSKKRAARRRRAGTAATCATWRTTSCST